MTYKTRLVQIGNSKGIRIPRQVVRQLGLEGEVELVVEEARLIIQAAKPVREGWEAAFAQMSQSGDDTLLEAETGTYFDQQEWTW